MIKIIEANFPAELRDLAQWVGYKIVWKPDANKFTKVPYSPNGDFEASSTNQATWATFDIAGRAVDFFGYDGKGFVFSKHDPYAGIDFDDCVVDGRIDPKVWTWVQLLDSYAEFSPSGTGIHVIVRGVMLDGKGRKNQECGVEMYDRVRFFTVTGRHVEGTPFTVNDRQLQLDALYAEFFPPKKSSASSTTHKPSGDIPSDDKELLDRMFASRDGDKIRRLWDGDCSGYPGKNGKPDHSSADIALCNSLAFWTSKDRARMDRMFRQSKLYRDKWNRQDYRDRTLDEAIAGTTEVYKGAKPRQQMAQREPEIADLPTATAHVNGNGTYHQDEAPKVAQDDKPDFRTDLGNGRRFARQHGQDVRYVTEWGFLIWNGKAWRRDQTGRIMELAKLTALSIFDEAKACLRLAQQAQEKAKTESEAGNSEAAKKATEQIESFNKMAKDLNAWALASQSAARLEAMIKLGKSESPIPARPEDFDKNPWLLNCPNGTVEQRTGELRPHRREDLITKLCPIEYNPNAQCPTWLAALSRWMDGKQHLADFLQRLTGYSITGDVSEQILPFPFGDGSNGKSTWMNTHLALLGKDYATQAAPELLTAGREGHPTEIADLRGMRLVASIEVDDGKRMAEGLVKQLTGGDKLKARFMRQDFFEFNPTHKIFLIANHKPVVKGTDHGIWRRILLIPFTVKITDAERDPRLGEKLEQELPGILAWAIRGCLEWQTQGLQVPEDIVAATTEYKAESDVLARFLDECTARVSVEVRASSLFKRYQKWCTENGEPELNSTRFGLEMGRRGYEKRVDKSSKQTFYISLGLIDDNPIAGSRE